MPVRDRVKTLSSPVVANSMVVWEFGRRDLLENVFQKMTQVAWVVHFQGKALNRWSRYAKRSGYLSSSPGNLLEHLESKFWVIETLKCVKLIGVLTRARMILSIKVLINRVLWLANKFPGL